MKDQLSNHATRRTCRAFSLVELMLSVLILTIIVLVLGQIMSQGTIITRTGNKRIDTDTQARAVLDRMAVDFGHMLKRTDIDCYIKAPVGYKNPKSHGKANKLQTGQQGNDQIAFFSQVPGYYPQTTGQSPLSLVAYRINSDNTSASYLKLQRMGKGLLWNGVSNPNQAPTNSNYTSPLVFLPLLINDRWPAATDGSATDTSYETIGPQVFRFEYYYLLKDGTITDVPAESWVSTKSSNANLNALSDVESIGVTIAVIDPSSRSLISQPTLFNLASDMADFKTAPGKGVGNLTKYIGFLETNWESAVESTAATGQTSDGSPFPSAAASAVRIYNRYFDVRTLANF